MTDAVEKGFRISPNSDSGDLFGHCVGGGREGDPITNLDLVADREKNFKLIMKDGRVYKNIL